MAVARVKTWIAGEVLTASDLNAEFNNILNNASDLANPLTKALDLNGFELVMDADADTSITADTDDRIDFRLSGSDLFRLDGTATTPVNGLDFVASAAGNATSITAQGSDTNININLTPKGSGTVTLAGPLASNSQAVNFSEGSAVASAETTNIWVTDGNTLHVTGTTTITSFGTAPNAGAVRWVIFDGALTLTHGANLALPGSADITTAAGDVARVYADTTTQHDVQYFRIDGKSVVTALSRSYLSGLTTSNGTDSDHDIDVAVGACRGADDDEDISLTSALTKQIDASWSAGNNAGGLSSSLTLSADTWYHMHAINVGGSADVGFDTSVTAANLVTDHSATAYRRIGSVLTDGSSNIIAYTQIDSHFYWGVAVADVAATNPGTSAVLRTLTTPLGVKVKAMLGIGLDDSSTGIVVYALLTPPDVTDTAASANAFDIGLGSGSATSLFSGASVEKHTDTSSQVRSRISHSAADIVLRIVTHGWIDSRGRDA